MNLENYTLKQQMIALIFSTYATYLILILIVCLSILYGTNNTIKNDSQEALFTQSGINVGKISNGTTYWLSKKLESGEKGFLDIYTYAMTDTYRTDYTLSNTTLSFFEYGDFYLAKPLTTDSRQTKPISLIDSAYYIPQSTPLDIPNFSKDINTTKSKTAHLDAYWKTLYRQNIDFVAGYVGFIKSGLFEQYPGIGTLDTDPNRNYDPRSRSWFIEAVENCDQTIFTSPYQDFNGKGWMITISKCIKNIETNQVVGAAGADMLIKEINENLKAITILNSGKVSLFEDTGVVVSDKEWEGSPTDKLGKKYSDLTNPEVSDDLWNEILNSKSGSTIEKTINHSNYIILVNRPQRDIFKKYILVSWILKDEVSAPINYIVEAMIRFNTSMTIGLILGFLVFIVFCIAIVILISNKITAPLQNIDNQINKLISRIGISDVFTRSTNDITQAFSTEQQQLNIQMNEFYRQNQQRQQENTNFVANEYFGGQNPIFFSSHNQQFPLGYVMPTAPEFSEN